MAIRASFFRRLFILAAAHIFGSLGLELLKIVTGEGTSFGDILRSPVRDLPYMIKLTWLGFPPASYVDLLFGWSFYLAPFAVTLILLPYFMRRRQRNRVRGFDVLPPKSGNG